MPNLYLGLVHFPIRNKQGVEVATSVTNLDIHDIARSSRTFGFSNYFIITPIKMQQQLVQRILDHWNTDVANQYNPDRQSALEFIRLEDSIEQSVQRIKELEGCEPLVCVTGANFKAYDGDVSVLAERLKLDKRPLFLLFGTGWGLSASVVDAAHFKLEPIFGKSSDGYNHLSVRSAVAIYCDRLTSKLV
jgi:hypothetical protein